MAHATFRHYDAGNSEHALQAHSGEHVEIIGPLELDHEEFTMSRVRFPDGTEGEAFDDELSDWTD